MTLTCIEDGASIRNGCPDVLALQCSPARLSSVRGYTHPAAHFSIKGSICLVPCLHIDLLGCGLKKKS